MHHPRYLMVPKVGMTSYGTTLLLSVLATVKRIQQRFDFDVIDAHFLCPDGFAAVWLGRLLQKPVLVSARGSDVNEYGKRPLIRRLLRSTLHRADGVIAVSQASKGSLVVLGTPAEKVTVVPNGVDAAMFHRVDRQEARQRLELPDRRIVPSVGPRSGSTRLGRSHRSSSTAASLLGVFHGVIGSARDHRVAASSR